MTSCLCGTPGFPNRRKLAAHIQERHSADEAPISAPRALLLADKIIDKARLRPEDYAVFGKEPPAVTPLPTREQRVAAEAREIAGRGLPTDAELDRAHEPLTTPELVSPATPPPPTTARVAQRPERRGATPEAAGSKPAPRSTTTPAPQATPMAKLKCPSCEFQAGRIQGLSRHLSETHGIKDKRQRAALLGGAGSKSKKPTGGGGAGKKSRPAAQDPVAVRSPNGAGSIAARVQGLVQAVAAGRSAQVELDAIRKAMAGA